MIKKTFFMIIFALIVDKFFVFYRFFAPITDKMVGMIIFAVHHDIVARDGFMAIVADYFSVGK